MIAYRGEVITKNLKTANDPVSMKNILKINSPAVSRWVINTVMPDLFRHPVK